MNAKSFIEFFVANFYQITGPILLASFVGYITWRNGFKARRAIAATALRAAFAPEIAALESPARTIDVRDILTNAFARHSEAVINFSGYINRFRKGEFKRVWHRYHSGHNIDAEGWGVPPKDRLFLDYVAMDDQTEAAKYALTRIDEILHFADHK